MTLAFDISRCMGSKDDQDNLVTPCNQCRRVLEQDPQGMWTPWFMISPIAKGKCDYLLKAEPKKQS